MNDHITVDPRICNGKPVIAGTRIPVTVVLDQLAETGSVQEVVQRYPELSPDQVTAALQYCHAMIDHTELEPEAA
ncbi:MAG: DUF433 domain-containing protein [Sedimentisphaerales bacterium]|nr:DUF433 domain-containing protein [Sedimentisphaerales bacterium]